MVAKPDSVRDDTGQAEGTPKKKISYLRSQQPTIQRVAPCDHFFLRHIV
jgi:hypothetical protein